MAEGTLVHPAYVDGLAAALQQRFSGAEVSVEQVRRDRYRFLVISSEFDRVGHPERQRAVWSVVEGAVGHDDLLKVAMIITMSRSEVVSE